MRNFQIWRSRNNKTGLTSIRVYDKNNVLVKQIEFIQTVLTSTTPGTLMLDEVKITSPSETEAERYRFLYNSPIPYKDTRSVDKWGYYNGASNTTLVPAINTQVSVNNFPNLSMQVTINIPGGNREPNETAMQAGTLSGIIYPTGGRTDFIYEAHRYKDSNGNIKLAGGLRIKQIQDVNESGTVTGYRNFKYSTSSSSVDGAGVLNVIPQDGTFSSDENFIYYTEVQCFEFNGSPTLLSSFKERTWTDNSIVNLFSETGSSVSYPYVTETASSDAAGTQTTGEAKHVFNVSSSYPLKVGNTNMVSYDRDDWTKGSESSVTVSKKNANSVQTVSGTSFDYNLNFGYGDNDTKITQWYAFKSHRFYGVDESTIADSYKKIDYLYKDLSTGRQLLINQSESMYDNSNIITRTSGYIYDTYGNVTQTTKNTSRSASEKQIVTSMYAKDMVDAGRDPAGLYAEMTANNIVGIPVEEKKYKDSVAVDNLLTTLITNYSKFNNKFFAPKETISKIKNNTTERKILFNYYDNRGNILEQQNIDGIKEVYLWGYWGHHPVAKITGSDWTAVKQNIDTAYLYNGVETQVTQQLNNLRNCYTNNANVHVSTYLYKPLIGMTSETDPSGVTTYYEYDSFGRLKCTKDDDGNILKQYDYHYINQ